MTELRDNLRSIGCQTTAGDCAPTRRRGSVFVTLYSAFCADLVTSRVVRS